MATPAFDLGLVESAAAQPRASFGGMELYPKLADKAAALAFSLVRNQPFADGNKRTAYGGFERHFIKRRPNETLFDRALI